MSSSHMALVVGLGGVTNGGKTTMCQSLQQLFSSDKYNIRVKTLHLDDYFHPDDDPRHIHLERFNHQDWDCLEAIDADRFIADLQSMRSEWDLLLVEGFLIFNISRNHHLFNLAYYFDLPYEECRKRRYERQYEPPNADRYFEDHVWHAHVKAKKEAVDLNKDVRLEAVDTAKESFEKIQAKIVKDIETALKCHGRM